VEERVSPVPEGGIDGEVEVAGFVDWAADLAGRLGNVVDQRVPATSSVFCGPASESDRFDRALPTTGRSWARASCKPLN
jgi:hypothetical protein